MKLAFLTGVLMALCITLIVDAADSQKTALSVEAQAGLRAGQCVILLRHALAPGTRDPDDFDVGDCSTQRNLSDQGRLQAQFIGDLLRVSGIREATVFSSQWCRCLETAHALEVGEVSELPMINSFFRHYERKSGQTQALREWLIQHRPDRRQDVTYPIIVVTHQVNIAALTGVFPRSGELIVIEADQSGATTVVARLEAAS